MSAATVETLTQIWQRVLQRAPIGVDENFFDLGGGQREIIQIFNEIRQTFGNDLPPIVIFQAPTIRSLAAILDNRQAPAIAPVVTLRSGKQGPPIFMAQGIGQSLLDFIGLTGYMDTERKIYGIQSPGSDGIAAPLDRMAELVSFHFDAIKAMQAKGPYFFIGYSFGGLVLLEVARRLLANGEKIALLTMLDSYPHSRYLLFAQKLEVAALSVRHRLRKKSQNQGLMPGELFLSAVRNVGEASRKAWNEYRPGYYSGDVKFVRAEHPSLFPSNASAVWDKLTGKLDVITVPGDHTGMISIRYKELAHVLSKLIREGDQA
ncbi:MAG TPA: thioesterase domain-containing protein [Verrucomicrobiae bacterium]|nr:thioesterase domain-containing protein [Verrucomicrobiae bacterium]